MYVKIPVHLMHVSQYSVYFSLHTATLVPSQAIVSNNVGDKVPNAVHQLLVYIISSFNLIPIVYKLMQPFFYLESCYNFQ